MANGTASGNKPTGVVDLDSSQTLENKTLDSTSTVLGSSVESPSRLDVKKGTQSELESYALTASDGQLCFATDSKKMYQVVDNALVDVGSASGGINYIPNPDFEIDADDWVGDTNLTIARSEVDPLRGTASGVISKGAVDATGEVVKTIPFTIDAADLAKKLYISADVDASDANYADGDLRWKIVKDPNGTPVTIRPNAEDILGGNFARLAWFQSDASITEYELQIECNSANVSAYSVKIDNISVGPRDAAYGSAMTEWKSFTMNIDGTTSAPTKSSTKDADHAVWRRVGDSMEIQYMYKHSTNTGAANGSGTYLFDLPSGYSIDKTKLSDADSSGGLGVVGSATGFGSATGTMIGSVVVGITGEDNQLRLLFGDETTSPANASSSFVNLNQAFVQYNFMATVPIVGWSSNGIMSEDIGNREVRVRGGNNNGEVLVGDVDDVVFNELEDTTGSWDGSVFTCPETGDYIIDGSVFFTSSIQTAIWAWVNGGAARQINQVVTSNIHQFDTTIRLEKGDTFSVRPSNGGTLRNDTGSIYNYIHIQKLAQPQTILETETVAAHYTSSIGQPVVTGGTDLIFEDIEHDTHNAYNTSTGVYTVPITGYYNISAQATAEPATYPSTTALTLIIAKNGTPIVQHNYFGNGSIIVLTSNPNATGLYLVKGDTIKIQSFNVNANLITTGTVASKNFFTIARIK